MRPQKLTLKNFMPFRSTDGQAHEIDFTNLDLFAITGPMASGKSSLIDAIAWCLYGRTARYGADSKGVISAGESLCEVTLDFTVGQRQFRAVRRTGKTTESGLSEWEGDEWIQDASGSERLTARIEQLLGLDFDGFTKTVILPQGKYAEFLSSKPSDRRELLASILELGVYSRMADRAKETAGHAKARAEVIRELLGQYAGVSRGRVEQQRQELVLVGQQLAEVTQREEMFARLEHQADHVAELSRRRATIQHEERLRKIDHDNAGRALGEAEARQQTLTQQLVRVAADREALGYDAARHEIVRRAYVHLQEYHQAQAEAHLKQQTLTSIQAELETLAQQLAAQEHSVLVAEETLQQRAMALESKITESGNALVLSEKLAEAKRWKELQQEQTRFSAQLRVQEEQLTQIQQSVMVLLQQETAKDGELRTLQQQREKQQEEEKERAALEDEAKTLGRELQEAVREERRVATELEEARTAVQAATQELEKCETVLKQAEQHEQGALHRLEEARRQHEVEHLRATLHIGDPCPVCESPVHAVPTTAERAMGDLPALQRAVEAERSRVNGARQAVQKANAAAAAAKTKNETAEREFAIRSAKRQEWQERFTRRFPGFASLATALRAAQQQRQELTAAGKTLEEKIQAAEKEKHTLSLKRQGAQQDEARLAESVRGLASRREADTIQIEKLSQSLAAYLSRGDNPETVLTVRQQELARLEREVRAAEQEQRRAESSLNTLKTLRIEKEGEAKLCASQHETIVLKGTREARAVRENLNLSATAGLPPLTTLERELATLAEKYERATVLAQEENTLRAEEADVDRLLADRRATLLERKRMLTESRQTLVQLEADLAHARHELRTSVTEQGVAEIGEDGQGLKEQREASREQVIALRERRSRLEAEIAEEERRCHEKEQEEQKLRAADNESRVAADLQKLLGAEFTDFLSQGAVEALMRDATLHLQRLTHGRYSFDIAYKRRAIELQIIDHEDNRRARPTHSLSGGETFLASLAIALSLSQGFRELATGKAARTSTECLILDEGFGTLDREGVQLVTETLQELRGEEGRMVGIITHVEEVAAAMPMRIEVRKGNRTSTISVTG